MVNTIWFRFDLSRFRKDFSVCSKVVIWCVNGNYYIMYYSIIMTVMDQVTVPAITTLKLLNSCNLLFIKLITQLQTYTFIFFITAGSLCCKLLWLNFFFCGELNNPVYNPQLITLSNNYKSNWNNKIVLLLRYIFQIFILFFFIFTFVSEYQNNW